MKKLTIIGGGPAGYAAALYATNFDIEVTLIESDTLGGTCLNRGCIPAKYWLHVAELNHEIDTSNEFGIEIKDKNINWQQTAQKRFDTVNKLVSGIGMLLKSKKVTVVEGWGSIKDKNTVNVKKQDGDEVDITSDFILIATGSKPREIPNIKVDEKSGSVVATMTPGNANQILATTSSGKVIRTHIESIRQIARVGRGVKVMSVDENEDVVAVALHDEDDEEKRIFFCDE